NVLARLAVGRPRPPGRCAALDPAIDHRHTNRRAFMADPIPAATIAALIAAAREEDAQLVPIASQEHRDVVTELSALAGRIENADPDYLAEIRAWTTDDPRRVDGVPAASV